MPLRQLSILQEQHFMGYVNHEKFHNIMEASILLIFSEN